jgi:hypothetical protein
VYADDSGGAQGIELDGSWEDCTLWDFPGQMELYPAHRLFLACETAVYVLVISGESATLATCRRQLDRWLSLIRSGMHPGCGRIEARVVVTHLDEMVIDERAELLRVVHAHVVTVFGDQFCVGDRCYATDYTAAGGGDVDIIRAELRRLRHIGVPRRPLPAQYQAVCDQVLTLARVTPRWPVVREDAIDTHGDASILPCLEDLGFVQRAGPDLILEPVTWLSRVMSAFIHP